MRIVIEIEGAEVSAKNSQVNIEESKLPPADVVEKAAAIGAQDAGPAPTETAQSPGVPPLRSQTTGLGAPVAGIGDLAAGTAPNTPSEH